MLPDLKWVLVPDRLGVHVAHSSAKYVTALV